jgi:flagellar protein FlbD
MIFVTRLDGQQLLVNEDQIAMAEATPDTVLSFTTGARLMIKERLPELDSKIVEFRRRAHEITFSELKQLEQQARIAMPVVPHEDEDNG